MITASAVERLIGCPGSGALAQANTSSEWTEAGLERHAEQEEAIGAGEIPDALREILTPSTRSEVKLAFDVATGAGRELGQGSDRGYSAAGPFEICMTADVLDVQADRVVIGDWKGWQDVDRAVTNVQLRTNALAAARAYGKSEALVWIGYLRNGLRWVDKAELDAIDLDAHAGALRRLHAAVGEQIRRKTAGQMPDVAEGRWCKHCPAAHVCPAKVVLMRRLVGGQEADDLELLMPFDDATAAQAWERLGYATQLLERIKRALYARASERPIPLGDGKFLGRHAKEGNEQLDGDIVHRIVTEAYNRDVADRAVIRSATKVRLNEALRVAVPKGTIGAAEKAVLDKVRAAGGAKRKTSEEVGVYTLKLAAGKDTE